MIGLAMLGLFCSCTRSNSSKPKEMTSQAVTTQNQPKVAKIVFVDQENACECTKKRIEASWAALQAALGPGSSIAVERIHLDMDPDRAGLYTQLEALMVPPGLYLLDNHERITKLLQGEVKTEQIKAALEEK
jgi:hypothetical protein